MEREGGVQVGELGGGEEGRWGCHGWVGCLVVGLVG